MVQMIIFGVFSFFALIGAVMSVTFKHPVRAVLSLIFCFVATAALWLLMQAEFLALVLIVVYVGAVMVLFLFVVMMLDVDRQKKHRWVPYWPIVLVIGLLLMGFLVWSMGGPWFDPKHYPIPQAFPQSYSSIKVLGTLLYTKYLYPFELAGVLLLCGMVSAIALTYRGKVKDSKQQIISQQIAADPSKNLKLKDVDQSGVSWKKEDNQ